MDIIALYIGLATVIGSIIGSFISTLLGRSQKVSSFRQDWINSLRSVFSEVLLQAEVFTDVAYQDNEEAYREKVKLLKAIYQSKVFLNLNEEPSQNLVKAIEEIPEIYMGKKGGSEIFKKNRHKIEDLMRDILKEEWDRVRDGELLWKTKRYLKKRFKSEPVSYHELVVIVFLLLFCYIAGIYIAVVI